MNKRSFLPKRIYVSENFPEEWLDPRRLLRPIHNLARQIPAYREKTFMSRDKLIIDGKQYTVAPINNLCTLPSDIIPSNSCEVKNEHTIAFLGPHSVYSNFHPAPFTEGKIRYSSAEQMIQAEKAALFKDGIAAQRIMKTKDPYRIKELGNQICNFDKSVWEKEQEQIVTRAVAAKFKQNKPLANILRNTGECVIVEASKDSFWGIGLSLCDRSVLDQKAWKNKGKMSEILDSVCKMLH